MIAARFMRMELVRTLRDRMFVFFSIGFPLVLFFIIAGPNRDEDDFGGTGINAALYYMVSLASFGSLTAVLSSGTGIALERSAGWTRQLRISPLTATAYISSKLVTAFGCALAVIVLLFAAGLTLDVSLSAGGYAETAALMLVALVPFAVLGIWLGHVLSSKSVGPAIGGGTALLALISGTWFPITSGFVREVAELLPSFWLVQASRGSLGGESWPLKAWVVVVAWTVVTAVMARRAYLRDAGR